MKKMLTAAAGILGVLLAAACATTDHCAAAIALGSLGALSLVIASDGEPVPGPTGR